MKKKRNRDPARYIAEKGNTDPVFPFARLRAARKFCRENPGYIVLERPNWSSIDQYKEVK
jgi:hypothetical protein